MAGSKAQKRRWRGATRADYGKPGKAGRQSKQARDRGTVLATPAEFARSDYELLDSGHGEKLERFGAIILARPCVHALWPPSHPELWGERHARFVRHANGQGTWQQRQHVPEAWLLKAGQQSLILKQTSFGHLGIFPEQHEQWTWIQDTLNAAQKTSAGPLEVLNLFAYTGGSTLAAAAAGAKVCHVDAAKGIVDWAKQNAKYSGLQQAPIRWIVDDVKVFLARELRRGRRYHGIIMDPPSYGRGPKGETWKIGQDLPLLFNLCLQLLHDQACFLLLSCHSAGLTPLVLRRLMQKFLSQERLGHLESGEMLLRSKGKSSALLDLPTGCFARWRK